MIHIHINPSKQFVIISGLNPIIVLADLQNGMGHDAANPSWRLSLPHICLATISSFLFGYHIGCVLHLCNFPF